MLFSDQRRSFGQSTVQQNRALRSSIKNEDTLAAPT